VILPSKKALELGLQLHPEDATKGWCGDPSRGAALGRPGYHDHGYKGRLYYSKIRLNRGGYDNLGTYFGVGEPLYWVHNDECTVDFVIRAPSRKRARALILERYPNANVRR